MEQQRRNDQERLKQLQVDQRLKPPEAAAQQHQQHQPPPPQKCPRCDSSNTKFCYYNNYSLSQPRYFCKSCRRYWTHGGTLRNVPVGGGCRKSKRPKPSAPSPSSSGGAASQPLSPTFPSQSMASALNSGQTMRPLPPIMGGAFYSGGSFLSSLAAMQSLSTGINQGATLNLGGGGGGQFDANMALMQGATLQSLKSQPPPPPPLQFQLQNDQFFQSQQNLSTPPRPSLPSWTQNFINRGPATAATTSAASSSFWSGGAAAPDGENQAGSSFNPNHWQDSNQGFDPSSDQ